MEGVSTREAPGTATPSGEAPGVAGAAGNGTHAGAERREPVGGRAVVYLFLAALAIRLLYLSQYANSSFFWVPALDSLYHDLVARALAGKPGGYEAIFHQPYFRAPLYCWFLGGVYALFGPSYWAARLIQAAVGASSCVLLYALGRRVFGPAAALIAAGAMAFYGPLVFFDGELHTPVAEVFLDLTFLLLAVRAMERPSPGRWGVAGLALGVAALARPNVLVAFLPGLAVLLRRPGGRRAAAAALFLAGAFLGPGLVTLRNYRVAGDPVFIASQGGINLFLGNRPEADGFTPSTPKRYAYDGPYEDSVALFGQRAAEEALGRRLTASEASAYWVRRAAAWWRREPLAALRLTWKKWVLAWSHREIRNNHAFDFVRAEFAPVLWVAIVGFAFAGTLGIPGMAIAWRESVAARFLASFVVLYTASFVLFFVADRFRLPVVPVLLLFAARALTWGGEVARSGRRSLLRAVPAALLLLGPGRLGNGDWYRTATPAARALDHWSAGNRYTRMGRLPEAERHYRKALALDPTNADIWTNLGAAQYYAGRPAEALESFRRALALSGPSAAGFYNLAMSELALSRPEPALRHLEQALQLDSNHRAAREELARLRSASGR